MSAIFLKRLISSSSAINETNEPNRSLVNQGFSLCRSLVIGNWNIQAFVNPQGRNNLHFHESGRITAIALGPIWYEQRFGSEALLVLANRLRSRAPLASAPVSTFRPLSGSFALILSDERTIHVMTDQLGSIKLYLDDQINTLSTSFLAVAEAQTKPTLNHQAAREYIWIEASHSNETPVSQVSTLNPGDCVDIDTGAAKEVWPPIRQEAAPYKNQNQAIEEIEASLLEQFRRIRTAFSSASVALSGGFDSRLVYALCERSGLSSSLFVYGSKNSSDVLIATQIADAEGVKIRTTDKVIAARRFDPITLTALDEAFNFFDGTPIDGALDSGIDRETRIEQGQYGAIILNGGGGEIFRNFFHLRDRQYSVKEICDAFYSQFPRKAFIDKTDQETFYERLIQEIKKSIGYDKDRVSRSDIELIYPLFRCRWWMNRNNSIANRLSPFLTPLVTPTIIQQAVRIPIIWKNSGRFQAALINQISPRLASYPSSYGFTFSDGPGFRSKISVISDTMKTPVLRPWLAEAGRKLRSTNRAGKTIEKFDNIGLNHPLQISKIINTDFLLGLGETARAATLEHLMLKLKITP